MREQCLESNVYVFSALALIYNLHRIKKYINFTENTTTISIIFIVKNFIIKYHLKKIYVSLITGL